MTDLTAPVHYLCISSANVDQHESVLRSVLRLQEKWIVKAEHADTLSGFLISALSFAELMGLIRGGSELWCSIGHSRLLAYCLITPPSEFTSLFKDEDRGRFFAEGDINFLETRYLFQVCTDKAISRKSVGSDLLGYLLKKVNCPLITDILTSPLNNSASIQFFKKNGFLEIGDLELAGYRDFGKLTSRVLIWNPENS